MLSVCHACTSGGTGQFAVWLQCGRLLKQGLAFAGEYAYGLGEMGWKGADSPCQVQMGTVQEDRISDNCMPVGIVNDCQEAGDAVAVDEGLPYTPSG
jgi:hypothetical protein